MYGVCKLCMVFASCVWCLPDMHDVCKLCMVFQVVYDLSCVRDVMYACWSVPGQDICRVSVLICPERGHALYE